MIVKELLNPSSIVVVLRYANSMSTKLLKESGAKMVLTKRFLPISFAEFLPCLKLLLKQSRWILILSLETEKQ